MSEEKEEVASVEAEVVDDDDDDTRNKDFEKFVENDLPMQIYREGGKTASSTGSPATKAAKAAVAAAVAGIDDDDDDDGGGKPTAKQRGRPSLEMRTTIDPDKDAKWLANVELLKEFKRINGHCNVPYLRPPHLTALMSWCHSQRRLYRTGKMHPSRLQLLESIGFRWNATKRGANEGAKWSWDDRFKQLKEYKEQHGTTTVDGETLDEKEMQLINWCQTQRLNYHAAKLSADKIQALDDLGFEWGEPVTTKKDSQKRSVALVVLGGSTPSAKRTKLNDGTHAPAEMSVVERPPTPLPDDETEWMEMLNKLKDIKQKEKKLPSSFPDDNALDRWVRHQKLMLRKEDLPRVRMERLVALGFQLPKGVTKANYRRKPPAAKAAASKKSPSQAKKGPGGSPTAQPAAGVAKAPPGATGGAAKAAPSKYPPAPPGIIPGAPPAGAVPPGAYPGMAWNPFMFTNPYGPPGMYNPQMNSYIQPKPTAQEGGAKKAAGSPPASAAAPNNQLVVAEDRSQQESLQYMQQENAKLQAENQKLQAVHSSVMTSLEEEKMIRRQGVQDLQSKIDKQNQIVTTQGTTIKKQGQQIKQLMEQLKDVVARQKAVQKYQEEQEREKERERAEQRRIQQEEERRQQEIQRQREMQELQRQHEEAERQRQHQEEQRRQSELHFLRTQFGL